MHRNYNNMYRFNNAYNSCTNIPNKESCGCAAVPLTESKSCACNQSTRVENKKCSPNPPLRNEKESCDCHDSHSERMKGSPRNPSFVSDKREMHEHMPIGMAYVPWQCFRDIYCIEKGFMVGTIFEELDKPFNC